MSKIYGVFEREENKEWYQDNGRRVMLGSMLCAGKDNDIVMIKSMIVELKSWLEDCDYEDILQILEELKGLKATLCAYIEDISRMEE